MNIVKIVQGRSSSLYFMGSSILSTGGVFKTSTWFENQRTVTMEDMMTLTDAFMAEYMRAWCDDSVPSDIEADRAFIVGGSIKGLRAIRTRISWEQIVTTSFSSFTRFIATSFNLEIIFSTNAGETRYLALDNSSPLCLALSLSNSPGLTNAFPSSVTRQGWQQICRKRRRRTKTWW